MSIFLSLTLFNSWQLGNKKLYRKGPAQIFWRFRSRWIWLRSLNLPWCTLGNANVDVKPYKVTYQDCFGLFQTKPEIEIAFSLTWKVHMNRKNSPEQEYKNTGFYLKKIDLGLIGALNRFIGPHTGSRVQYLGTLIVIKPRLVGFIKSTNFFVCNIFF